jgi:AmpD protein
LIWAIKRPFSLYSVHLARIIAALFFMLYYYPMLTVNKQTGLLEPVAFRLSPHHDERPAGAVVDMIVIHGISLPPGQFGGNAVEAFFAGKLDMTQNPYFATINHLRVSSHLFIRRTGEVIQFVPFHKRAWHAGESFYQDKTHCNDFSVGIELEGTDEVPYEQVQYQQLCAAITSLRQAYPAISEDRIVGHSDIAPGRKTDPGPVFDWDFIKRNVV